MNLLKGKTYHYRLPFVEINYDAIPVAPIRRSLSKFLDVMQHRELGPVLGTNEGDKCYHGEVLCVRTDQRGQGVGKILGMVFYAEKRSYYMNHILHEVNS